MPCSIVTAIPLNNYTYDKQTKNNCNDSSCCCLKIGISTSINTLVKKLATKKSGPQQEYYIFLAKEWFAGFSNAEDNFNIYRYASCNAWLFHSSEFSWKALTVLSGNYFNPSHEAADIKKISSEILSDDDKIRVYDVLSKFPNIRRNLARYDYYEKGGVTKSLSSVFNKEDTKTSLDEVSFLINKLREIHYYQIFEPPLKIGILSGYISARNEKPCSYYPHSGYRKAVQWMLDSKISNTMVMH